MERLKTDNLISHGQLSAIRHLTSRSVQLLALCPVSGVNVHDLMLGMEVSAGTALWQSQTGVINTFGQNV